MPDGLAAVSAESSSLAGLSETGSFLELTFQRFGLHFLTIGFLQAPAWYAFFATEFSVKRSLAELGLLSIWTMIPIISAFGAYVAVGGNDDTDRILLR